jgi:hypothetical protein
MAIEEPLIDLADAVRVSNLVAVLVQEQDGQALFPQVELARRVQALEQEPVVREAAREWRLGLRVEPEHGPVAERELPLDLQAGRELVLVPVVVVRAHGQPLDQPAAAGPIVSVATVHRGAEEAARSAAVAEITLAPVAAEAVPAWAAVVLVAAEAVVAAAVVAAAAEAVAVAAEDAGDEQFTDETKVYEIEIKHHELIKNFVACVCNRHVSCGGAFIASCVGN